MTGLIRHLGARRAAVVGHDWGAAVAWAVAQRHPEYISKLAALQVPPAAVWKKNISLRQMLKSWYMFFFQLPALPEWFIGRDDFAGLEKTFRGSARPGTFTDTDLAVTARRAGRARAGASNTTGNVFHSSTAARDRRWAETKIGVPRFHLRGRDRRPRDGALRRRHVEAPTRRRSRARHWVQQEYPQKSTRPSRAFWKKEVIDS